MASQPLLIYFWSYTRQDAGGKNRNKTLLLSHGVYFCMEILDTYKNFIKMRQKYNVQTGMRASKKEQLNVLLMKSPFEK